MSAPAGISIVNGRLIDPANGIDAPLDLHVLDGKVLAVGAAPAGFDPATVVDAAGQVVCPGLIDLAARLREPGFEYKATIASETLAASRSGITTLCCPPDTDPVIDTPAVVTLIRRRAKQARRARVLSVGALTQGLKGEQLSEMAALRAAGCVALGNAQAPLANTLVERRALEYAATFGIIVFLRPEDRHLRDGGCVHEGEVAARLGLPGIPPAAETVAVARDLALAEHTGAIIHFRGLSTATAVRMVRDAQAARIPVTADVSAHQLHLTDHDTLDFDAQCHVTPPLRTLRDRDALRQAVREGTIAAICSDHQPHEPDAKEAPFPATLPGISGLETLLPLALRLVQDGVLDLATAIERLTWGPARILNLPYGRLDPGQTADVCVIDPEAVWTLDPATMASAGKNTPFAGWELTGRVTHTIYEGRLVFRLGG
jgi:dihydroorotase